MKKMRMKALVIADSKEFYETNLANILRTSRFIIQFSSNISDACKQIEEENGAIGLVFLDLTSEVEASPNKIMYRLREKFFPEIIVCNKKKKASLKKHDISINLLSSGVCDIIHFPIYDGELIWVAKKAMTTYLTRTKIINKLSPLDYKQRTKEFFYLLQSRQKEGLPVTYKELELFFLPSNTKTSSAEIIKKISSPPIQDYKDTTILIIEDEPNTAHQYERYLNRFCYNTIVVKNGQEALSQIIKLSSLQIILLDVQLGDITGDELIKPILEYHPDSEIIMLTAFSEFDLINHTLQQGAFDFLVKGEFDLAILNQKIVQALHKQHFQQFLKKHIL